jgi:hypothetical protein
MNTDAMGVYGNYHLKRALVTQFGLGANLPEDAIYPINLADNAGRPLDGANRYTIHFDKGQTPPVDAFWSITLYDAEGFQVPNSLNRFAVSSWVPSTKLRLDLPFSVINEVEDTQLLPVLHYVGVGCTLCTKQHDFQAWYGRRPLWSRQGPPFVRVGCPLEAPNGPHI